MIPPFMETLRERERGSIALSICPLKNAAMLQNDGVDQALLLHDEEGL